jgi:2-polyprenyl-6-methoxyphenol hydroxylase-like FAD-dependent oxidoreductase
MIVEVVIVGSGIIGMYAADRLLDQQGEPG